MMKPSSKPRKGSHHRMCNANAKPPVGKHDYLRKRHHVMHSTITAANPHTISTKNSAKKLVSLRSSHANLA